MSLKTLAAQHRMIALAYPCEVAEQCSNRRYFFPVGLEPDVAAYVGLTVNIGEE